MTANPTVFLSRTGFREVEAASSGTANALSPGADINGVLFTGATNITVTAAADTLTGTILASNVVDSSLILLGNSASLPGNPTTTTQSLGTNNTTIATTAFVENAIAAAPSITWNQVTGPTTMLINNGYVANNSSQVVLTLPAIAIFGNTLRIVGKGAGGWQIAQNAGQTIHFGDDNTTSGTGGNISSQNSNDCLELLCTTTNTDFTVLSCIGNLTVN